MYRGPRGRSPNLIVVHTNEGPEGPTTAESLASYLNRPDIAVGYHFVVDEDSEVRLAADEQLVYGAGGVNARALHVCITGRAAQSLDEWTDASSRAATARAATIVREWGARWGIPVRARLTPYSVTVGNSGLCGHVDVKHPASGGHTDPGPHFPWDAFIAQIAGGGIIDDMYEQADRDRDNATALKADATLQRLAVLEEAVFTNDRRNRLAIIVKALTGQDGAVRSRLDRLISALIP